tara:strand:+ start:3125 stop:3538 length:414 start_codon:yes stop_codon:yes gene_type:complete
MSKPVKIKATIMWSFHNKINKMAKKYTVDLCNLSDAAEKSLKNNLGVTVNFKEDKKDKGKFIVCKSIKPINMVDAGGNSLSDISIGNGSKGVALVSFYDWDHQGQSGKSPTIVKMIVDDLVVYDAPVSVEDIEGEPL